ncbi:MAG: hypothetical protein KAH01_03020 [Caldisericia bacterium]|nr:hypothetical protein [Caldisericia bacterium]
MEFCLHKHNFEVEVQILVDEDDGKETILLFKNGEEIHDDSILRKVKREKNFKDNLQIARQNVFNKNSEYIRKFTELHKLSPEIPDWEKLKDQFKKTVPKLYTRYKFKEEKPNKEIVTEELQSEAKRNVKGIFFVKKRRKSYINARIEKKVSEKITAWHDKKNIFEKEQDKIEVFENDKLLKQYISWKKELNDRLNPTEQTINKQLYDVFTSIEYPSVASVVSVNYPEFSFKKPLMLDNIENLPLKCGVSFETVDEDKIVILDIDLPRIECYPTKKVSILTSGKISVKKKSLKDINQDYLRSISGISIYFASVCFSVSPTVEIVTVTGFNERINTATGNEENQSVYSVKYDKKNFGMLNIDNIDPSATIQFFENHMKLTKSFDLKIIVPFGES